MYNTVMIVLCDELEVVALRAMSKRAAVLLGVAETDGEWEVILSSQLHAEVMSHKINNNYTPHALKIACTGQVF